MSGQSWLQPLVGRQASRYSCPMKVAIELPAGQVTDLLAAPDAAFQAAAQRVLAQNLELYRRLA